MTGASYRDLDVFFPEDLSETLPANRCCPWTCSPWADELAGLPDQGHCLFPPASAFWPQSASGPSRKRGQEVRCESSSARAGRLTWASASPSPPPPPRRLPRGMARAEFSHMSLLYPRAFLCRMAPLSFVCQLPLLVHGSCPLMALTWFITTSPGYIEYYELRVSIPTVVSL